MFNSGFDVDMMGLTPLSPSAEEEEVVRTNMDFNCFMLMEMYHIPFLYKYISVGNKKIWIS